MISDMEDMEEMSDEGAGNGADEESWRPDGSGLSGASGGESDQGQGEGGYATRGNNIHIRKAQLREKRGIYFIHKKRRTEERNLKRQYILFTGNKERRKTAPAPGLQSGPRRAQEENSRRRFSPSRGNKSREVNRAVD